MSENKPKKSWDIYNNDISVQEIGDYAFPFREQEYLRVTKDLKNSQQDEHFVGFRCYVYPTGPEADGRIWWDITDGVAELEYSDDLDSVAMECSLKVWDSTDLTGGRKLTQVMTKGAKLALYVRDVETKTLKHIQDFVIWEIKRNSSDDPYVHFTCYDPSIYLLKSEDNYLFTKSTSPNKKGWNANSITKKIANTYGIRVGFIPKASYTIPYFRVDNGSVWDVILKAWTEERKQTGVRYVLRMEKGKLFIRPKQTKRTFWGVVEGSNLIDMSFTDSLEGMATAVRAISPNQETGSVSNSNPVADLSANELPEEKLEDLGGQRPTSEKEDKSTKSVTSEVVSAWRRSTASSFDPGKEKALAYGDAPSSSLKGFAELSSNSADSADWDWAALGGLPAYTKIDVKYKGKVITVPKIDVGRGGPGIGPVPRGIDLTVASMRELTGNPSNLVQVEWRVHNQSLGAVETNPGGGNMSAPGQDVIVLRKDAIETYGYLQKLISTDPGTKKSTLEKAAVNALYEFGRDNYDAELTTYLLPFLRAGDPIYVRDAGTGLRGRYYCSDVSHTLSASGCRTSVGLNWLDVVPSLEIEKEEKAPPQPPQQPGGYGGGGYGGGVVGGQLPTSAGCGPCPGGSWGGGPYRGTHTMGDWQSDNAYDIFAPDGTPCIAVEDCVVTKVSDFNPDKRTWGIGVTVRTASGTSLFYKHLKAVSDGIRVGAKLRPRQIIGYLGTGVNGGPHLHFGVEPPASPDRYRNAACSGSSIPQLDATRGAVQGVTSNTHLVKFSVVPYGGQEAESTVYLRDTIAQPGSWVLLQLDQTTIGGPMSVLCKVAVLPKSTDKKYNGVVSRNTIKRRIPSANYPNKSVDQTFLVIPANAGMVIATGIASDIADITDGIGGMW